MNRNQGKKKLKLSKILLLAKSKWQMLMDVFYVPKSRKEYKRLRNFLSS